MSAALVLTPRSIVYALVSAPTSAPSHPLRVDEEVDLIIGRMGPWLASYRRPSGKSVMYIMDEVGSRLQHSEPFASPENESGEGFDCCLVLDPRTGASYTAFWPSRDVEEGEVAYCRGLPNRLGLRLSSLNVLAAFEDPPAEQGEEELEQLHDQISKLRSCLKVSDGKGSEAMAPARPERGGVC